MGGERQSLIDVELARTEFRLDVLKLRKQLSELGVGKSSEDAPAPTLVTTRQGTVVEPASGAAAVPKTEPAKPQPAGAGSA